MEAFVREEPDNEGDEQDEGDDDNEEDEDDEDDDEATRSDHRLSPSVLNPPSPGSRIVPLPF